LEYRRYELWNKNHREDECSEKNASPSPTRFIEKVGENERPCEKNKCVELEGQAEVTVPPVEVDPAGHKELCEERPEPFRFRGHVEVLQRKDSESGAKYQRENNQRSQG
jgi:hypothetical protein